MYSLVSAIGEPLAGGSRWAEVQIGNLPLAQIFATYANVKAVLSNSFLPTNVALDLADIRGEFGGQSLTFDQFLASLGNRSLPTTLELPVLKTRFAKYADGVHAGYKINPIHPLFAANAELPPSELTWLRLTRRNTDYDLFLRSCLVSVNGFYHQTDADTNGVYVKNGNVSSVLSGRNELGIYSFRELGTLTQIPITESMVYKQLPNQRLRDRAYLDLGVDLTGKTVLLVLGGYLHLMDPKTFYLVSHSTLAIDFNNLPLFERYHESKDIIDLTSLPIERTSRNPSQIGVDDFLSDENITAYLTLSQSFVVLLDNPNIFSERTAVREAPNSHTYISNVRPLYPMVGGYGRVLNYWYTYEDRQYSLTCTTSAKHNYVHNTVDSLKQRTVADSRLPYFQAEPSAGFFLLVGRDV